MNKISNRATDESLVQLLYSKAQGSKMLGVSLRTLDTLIATRELSVRRIGRRVLIPHAVLVSFARHDHRSDKKAA